MAAASWARQPVDVVGDTRRNGVPYAGMGRKRVWSVAVCNPPRRRLVVATAAAVAVLAIAGHCGLLRSVPQSPPSQSSLTSLGGKLTAGAAQVHLVDGLPNCKSSKVLVTAALPKSATTALIALGAGLAAIIGTALLVQLVVPAGRDPPRVLVSARTGQDLLTRLCLARR